MDATTTNLIVALARALNIQPEMLALLFNERAENQEYFDKLLMKQQTEEAKKP